MAQSLSMKFPAIKSNRFKRSLILAAISFLNSGPGGREQHWNPIVTTVVNEDDDGHLGF